MNTRIKIYIRCSGQRFDLYSKKDGDIGLEIGDDYFGSIFQYYDNNTEEYEECWVLRGVIRAIRSEREKYEISEEVKDNQVLHIQVANIIEKYESDMFFVPTVQGNLDFINSCSVGELM